MILWKLKRKIHVSRLITIACAGIFVGVFAAQYINIQYISSLACLITSLILILIVILRRYIYLMPFIIIGGVLLGLWRGSVSQDELVTMKPLYGQSVVISGLAKYDVDTGTSDQIIIRLGNLSIGKN